VSVYDVWTPFSRQPQAGYDITDEESKHLFDGATIWTPPQAWRTVDSITIYALIVREVSPMRCQDRDFDA